MFGCYVGAIIAFLKKARLVMDCKNYKTRTKNYRKIGYCIRDKKEVPLFCKKCNNIEYKEKSKPCKIKKHLSTKATDIPQSIKKKVWERDNGCCVICGNNYNVMPNSHFVRRSHGGLGIEENIFTACTNFTPLKCHERWDHYQCTEEEIERVKNHFKNHYPGWNEDDLVYKKWQ